MVNIMWKSHTVPFLPILYLKVLIRIIRFFWFGTACELLAVLHCSSSLHFHCSDFNPSLQICDVWYYFPSNVYSLKCLLIFPTWRGQEWDKYSPYLCVTNLRCSVNVHRISLLWTSFTSVAFQSCQVLRGNMNTVSKRTALNTFFKILFPEYSFGLVMSERFQSIFVFLNNKTMECELDVFVSSDPAANRLIFSPLFTLF